MKKTLIALAAIAAVSSAMADVSITGYFDRGYGIVNNTNANANFSSVSSNAGTSQLYFKGAEKISSDLTAIFTLENDFQDNGGATQGTVVQPSQNAGWGNGELFIGATSASMGTVRLGVPNSFMLGTVTSVGSPGYGTGWGSAYSTGFSIFNGIGTGATNYGGTLTTSNALTSTTAVTGARDIRIANTIQYSSPVMNGLSFGVGFAPQNNNVANGVGNTVGMTEYLLKYEAPQFTIAYDSARYVVGSLGTYQNKLTPSAASAAGVSTTGLPAALTVGDYNILADVKGSTTPLANYTNTHNFLGGNYAINDQIKIYGGYGSFTSSDNLAVGRSTQIGASYRMGAWEFMALDAQVQDSNSGLASTGANIQLNRSMESVGANYWLSKQTRVYARYETINFGTNTTSFAGSSQTRSTLGLSTSF